MFQIMDLWFKFLPHWYTVKDFMMDVDQWHKEGYMDRGTWSHLQKYVKPDVLPVSVSDITITNGNRITNATCFSSGNEGNYNLFVYLFTNNIIITIILIT